MVDFCSLVNLHLSDDKNPSNTRSLRVAEIEIISISATLDDSERHTDTIKDSKIFMETFQRPKKTESILEHLNLAPKMRQPIISYPLISSKTMKDLQRLC